MSTQQQVIIDNTLESATGGHTLHRVEIARLIVDFPLHLQNNTERSIGLDWLSIPKSKFIVSLRDDVITLMKTIGCSEGQKCDASAYFSYREDGYLVPVISFWRDESNEGTEDRSSSNEIHIALKHYLSEIFEKFPFAANQNDGVATDEVPRAESVLALALAKSIQSQFGGRPAPFASEIQIAGETFPCHGLIRSSSTTGVTELPELELDGHVSKWDVTNHIVTLKLLNCRKTMKFSYDRTNLECGWRTLRDGLDEEIIFSVTLRHSHVDNIDTLELMSATPNTDLFTGL